MALYSESTVPVSRPQLPREAGATLQGWGYDRFSLVAASSHPGQRRAGKNTDADSGRVDDKVAEACVSTGNHQLGKLDPRHDALDALAAGFPAGTVSGAPKVRAMEIIDELEKEKRGLYAGCVGYFSAAGEMDSCIVLRTALVKDGKMYVQAGAGIVADSDPDSEQQECINKAKALFRAAEEARRFASGAGKGQ